MSRIRFKQVDEISCTTVSCAQAAYLRHCKLKKFIVLFQYNGMIEKRKDYNDAHRQFLLILPMCIDQLTQLRYNALWQY